ncbi:transporter substrate-binding domain-containing protein [Brevibacterium sp. 5221]|uniref:Transporter substrate-binding domain-containing protein n=1 Tax=Brevibacterium rongguiense TaxID=2695267 RepID=A0A6N9H7Y8_9MICO|nr:MULTISPECIES: ABC transporter substrate-binding protein [Brevibacterium]MYM19684.1 transporter substrate-binding domain-containing protein [Brevibacterium rongguiense]WAL39930.1 ABC transporter substrate-binding protein [Brevibacterium sp. BRM-1]
MKRSVSILALAAAATLALSACGGSDSGDSKGGDSDGPDLVNEGKLTLCSDIPYEPFEFTKDNENVGFDIDMADALAKKLGVELDTITTPFESIESGVALNTGKCDIALSGMGATDERKTKMDFTDIYLKDNLAMMTKKGSGIKTLDDAKSKSVGVQKATTGEAYAKDHGVDPVQFKDTGLLNNAMASGKVDAAVANISTIYAATQAHDNLEMVQDFGTGELIGAAVKKGNTKLADSFNEMLKSKLDDGSYSKLVDQWFGEVGKAAKVTEAKEG